MTRDEFVDQWGSVIASTLGALAASRFDADVDDLLFEAEDNVRFNW